MKKIFSTMVMVAAMAIFISSAQAAIKIQVASEVQDGVAFIKGNGAVPGAQITWEGSLVTRANNKNGGFSFFGVLPDDCTGVLSDGSQTGSVTVLNCTAVTPRTAADAPAPVAKTGQTRDPTPGSDGALEKGVAWPNPRFTDNANGTVTDNLTGLIWLKNANCFRVTDGGLRSWQTAISLANNLASGACGLSDGSSPGDWRLPNRNELTSLLDLGQRDPALPRGHSFTNFQSARYWSSTEAIVGAAWRVDFLDGAVTDGTKANFFFVTFVRGGS